MKSMRAENNWRNKTVFRRRELQVSPFRRFNADKTARLEASGSDVSKSNTQRKKSQFGGTGRVIPAVREKMEMIADQPKQTTVESDENQLWDEGETLSELLRRESADILKQFITRKISLKPLLNINELEISDLVTGLKIISKVCAEENVPYVIKFMQKLLALKNSFVLSVLLILSKILTKNCSDRNEIASTILEILEALSVRCPSSSLDVLQMLLPHLRNVLQASKEESNEILFPRLIDLELMASKWAEENCTLKYQKSPPMETSPPPCDFREMSLILSQDEVNSSKLFLRANVTDDKYEDVEHYLDVQFRLMREDMFQDFRKCILAYRSRSDQVMREGDLENGRIYRGAFVVNMKCGLRGVTYVLSVSTECTVDWAQTKKLMPLSIVCISQNGFNTFNFAVIDDRFPMSGTSNSCMLHLLIESNTKDLIWNFLEPYEIIETSAFYESYRHALARLQVLHDWNFPLKNCLIDFKDCDETPEYIKRKKQLYNKRGNSKLAELLDEHQLKAFHLALDNRVALIQGPPGTGKTYIGLKIVRWLLALTRLERGSPIVVICYTNHALDQFLENIMNFTTKVVRIGGQSKSSVLEPHNITSITKAVQKHLKKISKKKYLREVRWDEEESSEESDSDEKYRKSLNIAQNLTHDELVKSSVGKWFYKVKKYSRCITDLVKLMVAVVTTPLTNSEALKLIFSKNINQILRRRIHRTGNKLYNSKFCKTVNKALTEWLCLSPKKINIYEKNQEIRRCIAEELLGLTMKQSAKTFPHAPLSADHHIHKTFLRIWELEGAHLLNQTSIELDSKKAETFKTTSNLFQKVRSFIQTLSSSEERVFFILLKSSLKWAEMDNIQVDARNDNIWQLGLLERWELFSVWMQDAIDDVDVKLGKMEGKHQMYLETLRSSEVTDALTYTQRADVVGLTTSGAAKHWKMLHCMQPKVVIVEEAAEVLETHIVTSLASSIEHLILIGDHQQLKPSPVVYELARKYKLDVSLFERLFTNGVPSQCLQMQHRMRPCIVDLLVPEIYESLDNHPSVMKYEDVKGMTENMFFIKHEQQENGDGESKSYSNLHEATFMVALCRYLLQQGYAPENITILTTYVGQLILFKALMKKSNLQEVMVTTVDNFQGEENDIILLSFVRSNSREIMGFIRASNRVCVALSRARKGLYCIGNFDLFASKSQLWKQLTEKLEKKALISDELKVQCQNHPKVITSLKTSSDFRKVPHGGCNTICETRLPCGHSCRLVCHPEAEEHDSTSCNRSCSVELSKYSPEEKCQEYANYESCANDTKEDDVGNKKSKLIVEPCDNCDGTKTVSYDETTLKSSHADESTSPSLVEKKLPCCHTVLLPSDQDENSYLCETLVSDELPCGHPILVPCHIQEQLHTVQCKYIETKIMPCGMEVRHLCNKDFEHDDCASKLSLSCGHEIPCNIDAENYRCEKNIQQVLPCGHEVIVPCQNSCALSECNALIPVTASCGHRLFAPCWSYTRNAKDAQIHCREKCEDILSCGHKCPGSCGQCYILQIHEACRVEVLKTLPCGHHLQWECGRPLPVCEEQCQFRCKHSQCINQCDFPCSKCRRPCEWRCEHQQCGQLCGDLCDRPSCDFPCAQRFPCGHDCVGFCGEPCPSHCIVCNQERNLNSVVTKGGAVLVEDCGHVVEAGILESHLLNTLPIACPTCPQCGAIITRNVRFGNLIKKWLDKTKRKFVDIEFQSRFSTQDVSDKITSLISNQLNFDLDDCFADEIQNSNLTDFALEASKKIISNIAILNSVKLLLIRLGKEADSCCSVFTFELLNDWLLTHKISANQQQIEESSRVVRRIAILAMIKSLAQPNPLATGEAVGQPKLLISAEQKVNDLCSQVLVLLERRRFGPHEEKQILNLVDEMKASSCSQAAILVNYVSQLNPSSE